MGVYHCHVNSFSNFLPHNPHPLQWKAHHFTSPNKIIPINPIFNHKIIPINLLHNIQFYFKIKNKEEKLTKKNFKKQNKPMRKLGKMRLPVRHEKWGCCCRFSLALPHSLSSFSSSQAKRLWNCSKIFTSLNPICIGLRDCFASEWLTHNIPIEGGWRPHDELLKCPWFCPHLYTQLQIWPHLWAILFHQQLRLYF